MWGLVILIAVMKEKLSSVCVIFSFIIIFVFFFNFGCLFSSGGCLFTASIAVKVLTVKVQCDGGIAFAQLILGRHLVFTGILDGNIFDFKCGKVLMAIFIDWQLWFGEEEELFVSAIDKETLSGLSTTLCLSLSATGLALCDHATWGTGSALITHSNKRRFPSSSWRIAGFLTNVGACPSICLYTGKLHNF